MFRLQRIFTLVVDAPNFKDDTEVSRFGEENMGSDKSVKIHLLAVLFHEYGTVILVYLATLFLNLFAAAFALNRKFFLKDTGRKLSHLDKQLHMGQTEVRDPSLEEEVD